MKGIDIKKYISEKFGLSVPSAAVYVVLKALEDRGLVYAKWSEDSEGTRVKLYYVTSEGKEYLKEKIEAIKSIKKILDYILEEVS